MATADELTSLCAINIHGAAFTDKEPSMLYNVMGRVSSHVPRAKRIDLYCMERNENGWLEWSMDVVYLSGGTIHIGIIQREPGADVEYHS